MHINIFIPPSREYDLELTIPLAGMQSNSILHSRERRFCNNFAEMHIKIYIPPFAGIRSRINSSACGNAIKILHPRKRRFCIYFGSRSPRAEMHIKIFIPPSQEYDPESIVPLAGMQSKFYIPASGDFFFISVHRPRERRSRDAHENLQFPLAGILSSADNSACGNATKILHLRERIFCNYFGSRSRLRKCTISCVSPQVEIRSGRRISASRICKRMCAVPQAVLQEIRSFLIPAWSSHLHITEKMFKILALS